MFTVEVKGIDVLNATIARIKKNAPEAVGKVLYEGALQTHGEAVRSIQGHVSAGETYGKHTASAPGNPPNTDTGNLVSNITVQKIAGGFDVGSRSGAPYGVALEFGTSKMMPRPWLRPAAEKGIKAALDMVRRMRL